ncbi:metallophosphoesterase family protein [uncultured Sphingomonas sp.]|uniref:metallophosphoesterase family protein n=1 Tax=uncultured Sphingomonas sp. TaxID=158754 RepID=UPI0035CA8C0C
MKLFHVSDVHFGAEDTDAIAWFDQLVANEKPDAVIMTGDLTMRARAHEFEAGANWLRALKVPVTLEVGNHDIPYYWDPIRRFLFPYKRYEKLERMIERELHLPGLTIVPLQTTARAQWRWNWSKGHVSPTALDRALAAVAKAPSGDLIFIAGHHPLVEAGTRGTARTENGEEALTALAAAGAHAVLSGHVHDAFDVPVERGGWTVRMIGAGTLSKRVRATPPAFNEIRVADGRFETIVRSFSPDPERSISGTTRSGTRR